MDDTDKLKFNTVDEYIAAQPGKVKILLEKLRMTIKHAAPEATELISYNMPAFKTGRILAYYAAHKAHIGFYPASTVIMQVFADDLKEYNTSKGGMQFPFEKGIPEALVIKIILYRVAENDLKLKTRKK